MEFAEIDYTDPAIIMGFVLAVICDGAFLGLIGIAIPGVGLAIAMFVVGAHYLFGIVLLAMLIGKLHGWLAKLLFVLAVVLPLPLLTIGIILGIILSNKLIAFVAEQVIIQGIAVATAGAGEALEAGAVAEAGVETAGVAVEAAAEAAEGAEAVGQAGEAISQAGEAAGGVGGAPGAGMGTPAEAEEGMAGEGGEEAAKEAEIEKQLEAEAEREPEELEREKLLEKMPEPEEPEEEVPEEPGEEEKERERRAKKIFKGIKGAGEAIDKATGGEGEKEREEEEEDEEEVPEGEAPAA